MVVLSRDIHHLFLQSIISRRVVSDKLARVLWSKCVDVVKAADDELEINHDPNGFDEFVNQINANLISVDLKLSLTSDEVTGEKIWAIVNTKVDELAQVATDYSTVEIAYFKAVVEQIVLAPSQSYSIPTMAALREVNSLKPTMTKSQAEVVLESFVGKGWLIKSHRNRFSLSSRALSELQGYLKSNYEDDIHECTLCYDLLTKGIGCYVPACGARLHKHCYRRFARERNSCPSCRSSWEDPQRLLKIGEEAVKDGEDQRRMRKRDDKVDEEYESEDESEDEPEPETKPTKSRDQEVRKGTKRLEQDQEESTDEDMEVEEHSPPPRKSQSRNRRR